MLQRHVENLETNVFNGIYLISILIDPIPQFALFTDHTILFCCSFNKSPSTTYNHENTPKHTFLT